MKEESCRRKDAGVMEEESWRRSDGGINNNNNNNNLNFHADVLLCASRLHWKEGYIPQFLG